MHRATATELIDAGSAWAAGDPGTDVDNKIYMPVCDGCCRYFEPRNLIMDDNGDALCSECTKARAQ